MTYPGEHDHAATLRALCDDVLAPLGRDEVPHETWDAMTAALNEVEREALALLAGLWDEARDDGFEAGVESAVFTCATDDEHNDRVADEFGSTEFLRFVLEVAKEAAREAPHLWAFQIAPASLVRMLR